MCGIVGYIGGDASPEAGAAVLGDMVAAVAHRGPDATGVRAFAGAGLGHARLSIVAIADGAQPMRGPDPTTQISFNGEIFNHVELREELAGMGRRFRTASDTEVILHLYDLMGPDCVVRLNGDFAFALWDGARRRMVLARDRMGVRPLYHARRGGTLWFASEVKALLAVPGIDAELDPLALDQIFTLWAPIAPRTPFKGISELPPAHVMVADADGARVEPYWRMAFPDRNDAPSALPESETAERVAELLADATRIRMRADVPVGSYLSGGLDSSVVSALAAREVGGDLRTFSVAFDSPEHDEREQQAAMARALGSRHAVVECGPGDIARVFPDVVRHAERPVLRTAPAPMHMLAGLVRREGCKVVLTGEGADEVFAGYDIFKEAAVRRFCARRPGSRLRPLLFRRLYHYLPGLQRQNAGSLAAFFGVAADGLDDPLFSHRPRLRGTSGTKLFFSADLRESLAGYDAAEEMAAALPADFPRWHPLHQAQWLEAAHLLPGYILSSQGDRMAMAHGVEGRFPFLDHRLVELAATIPPAMKLKGLTEKHILRRASKGLVPQAILERAKQPFRAPDSVSFAGARAPAYVAELLAPAAVAATGCFNPSAVARLAGKCAAGGASGFRDNAAFVGILSTQLWHAHFAGGAALPVPDRHHTEDRRRLP